VVPYRRERKPQCPLNSPQVDSWRQLHDVHYPETIGSHGRYFTLSASPKEMSIASSNR
jgi:hypothetical protein